MTKVLANTFYVVQNLVIFIWLNRTIRLKAVINECKSESKARLYVNLLKVNLVKLRTKTHLSLK